MADRTGSPREAVSAGERVTLKVYICSTCGKIRNFSGDDRCEGKDPCDKWIGTAVVPARLLEEAHEALHTLRGILSRDDDRVAQERERCAKVMENMADGRQSEWDLACAEGAAKIREGK